MSDNWNFKHFKFEDFNCSCCGFNNIDLNFVAKLEDMRIEIGLPFVILSGCRCEKHNKEVGGEPDSAHLKGLAGDIAIPDSGMRNTFIETSYKYFKRRGIGKIFIHVDSDETLPQNVTWVYK